MKKQGFTLIELVVVILIMGILAAVTVPKLFEINCRKDMRACKADDPESYQKACIIYPDKCLSKNDLKTAILSYCSQHDRQCKAKLGLDRINLLSFVDVVGDTKNDTLLQHDTVYVTKRETVYVERAMPNSTENCIENCRKSNTVDEMFKICVREKCVK